MSEVIDSSLAFTEDFGTQLPTLLGDDYFNDKEKQQPTKYFENVKDLPTLLKRAVNADRTISRHGEQLKKATEGFVKIPGEGATPEEVQAYRKAVGVPDKPEGYELNMPFVTRSAEDRAGYEAIAKEIRQAAHEAGIPATKLSAVWDKVVTALAAQDQALEAKGMEMLAADVQALKDAKKEKYDSFIQDTNKVASHFDVKGDATLGTKDNLIGSNFMKLMDTMGIKDTPVVREFLGAIAPLVLEGKTTIGASKQGADGGQWFTDYPEVGNPQEMSFDESGQQMT